MKTTETLKFFKKSETYQSKEIDMAKNLINEHGDILWIDSSFKNLYKKFVDEDAISKYVNTKIAFPIYENPKLLDDVECLESYPLILFVLILSGSEEWVDKVINKHSKVLLNVELDRVISTFKGLKSFELTEVLSQQTIGKEKISITKEILLKRLFKIVFSLFSEKGFQSIAKKFFTELEKIQITSELIVQLSLQKEFFDALKNSEYVDLTKAMLKKPSELTDDKTLKKYKFYDSSVFKKAVQAFEFAELKKIKRLEYIRYLSQEELLQKLLKDVDIDILNYVLNESILKLEDIPKDVLTNYQDVSEKIYSHLNGESTPVKLFSDKKIEKKALILEEIF